MAYRLTTEKPQPQSKGPPRFVLAHLKNDAPQADIDAIKAIPGVTVVSETPRLVLVSGPTSLEAMKAAMPKMSGWKAYEENANYHPCGESE